MTRGAGSPEPSSHDVTALLLAWGDGDESALARLIPIVHDELHRIARACMAGEKGDHTLQATALVNEAYLRLIGTQSMNWQNRAHFLAMAARLMRRILVDFARSKQYQKRGGGAMNVSLAADARALRRAGPRPGRTRRCARGAGKGRRTKEPGHRNAVLRRPEREGDGRSAECVRRDRHARLETREGLAASAVARGRHQAGGSIVDP